MNGLILKLHELLRIKDSLKACDNGKFIVPQFHWTLSFDVHNVLMVDFFLV